MSIVVGRLVKPVGGLLVGVVGVVLIFMRGYLIPGTPTVTRRYFPEPILAWFDHEDVTGSVADESSEVEMERETEATIDPEESLRKAGALTVCQKGVDLCLDEQFRKEWHAAMSEAIGNLQTEVKTLIPPSSRQSVTVEFRGETVVARISDTTIAQWPSRAAAVADIAGGSLLAEKDPEWENRSFANRTQLLAGLRLWLDRCSVCDGTLGYEETTVETCCRSKEVFSMSCKECGAQILEVPLSERD